MSQERPSVYVVDDDISVRESLKNLFRSVGLNAEAFETAQEFLSGHRPEIPGCLILDVRLPGMSGLDLQRALAENKVDIPIIFITAHGDVQMSVRAMKLGAVEFLSKPYRDQELLDAVRQAIERDRENRSRWKEIAELQGRYESLSHREREVMGLVVQGYPNKLIAGELGISQATVKLHRGRSMEKMRAGSLADLIRMAEKIAARDRSRTVL
jgi:FixJ family two-component response regulator